MSEFCKIGQGDSFHFKIFVNEERSHATIFILVSFERLTFQTHNHNKESSTQIKVFLVSSKSFKSQVKFKEIPHPWCTRTTWYFDETATKDDVFAAYSKKHVFLILRGLQTKISAVELSKEPSNAKFPTENFKQLSEIIGFFTLESDAYKFMIVLRDGKVWSFTFDVESSTFKLKQEKELELPPETPKKAFIFDSHFTTLRLGQNLSKVLIIQLKSRKTCYYVVKTNESNLEFSPPCMILTGFKCDIDKVFGRFLVVNQKNAKECTELIELGSPDYSKVVTTLQLGTSSDYQTGVEASLLQDNFLVKYVKKHHFFVWEHFDQLKFVQLSERRCITQLSDNFVLKLRVESLQLEMRDIGSNRHLKTIELPAEIQYQKKVRNFLPIPMASAKDKKHEFMVLMLNTDHEKEEYSEARYSTLILIDIEKEKSHLIVKFSKVNDYVRWLVFPSEKELIWQNSNQLVKFEIVLPENQSQAKTFTRKINKSKTFLRQVTHEESEWLIIQTKVLIPNFPRDEKAFFHFDPSHNEVYFMDKKPQETDDLCYIKKIKAIEQADSPSKPSPEMVKELKQQMTINSQKAQERRDSSAKSQLRSRRKTLFELQGITQIEETNVLVVKSDLTESTADDQCLQNERLQHGQCETQIDLNSKELYTFEPEQISAAINHNNSSMVILLADHDFVWLQKYKRDQDSWKHESTYKSVSVRDAVDVSFFIDDQILIKSKHEFSIFQTLDGNKGQINLKVKLSNFHNNQLTSSQGYVAIGRFKDSLLFDVGSNNKNSKDPENAEHGPKNLRQLLDRIKTNIQQRSSATQTEHDRYYLCIRESLFDLKTTQRSFSIAINYADLKYWLKVPGKTKTRNLAIKNNEKKPQFQENTMLSMRYLLDIDIWNIVIRQGLINRSVEISPYQKERIVYPVLSNDNKNLLHIFSANNYEALQEVFCKCEIESCLDQSKKLFPFFKDLQNKSPLDYAYEQQQSLIINFLLRKTIELQDCFESQHLLTSTCKPKENSPSKQRSLLESVISDSLDISFVFDSMLFTKEISKESFNVSSLRKSQQGEKDNFPEMHKNPATFTAAYGSNSIFEFFTDDSVYETMFSEKFPASEQGDQPAEEHLIEYDLDYFLTEKSNEFVFNLFRLLSETENMSYFRSRFIQRMINHQWFNIFRKSYMKILWVHVLMYGLNLVDVLLINYDTRGVCQARIGINMLTVIPIVFALFKIEGRRIKKGILRFAYYLAFVCASLLDGFSCWTEDYDPYDEEIVADRMLRTRQVDDSNTEYSMLTQELPIKQCARVAYTILVLLGMVKILHRFQISEGLSFMVKMLQRTMVEIIPFGKMFLSFIVMFMFAINALNVPRAETNNSDDYANIQFTPFELFIYVFRIALGDFQVQGLKRMQDATLVAAWIIWFAIVMFNSIIFLNFLIAVVSDVFAQVMETRSEEHYQMRAKILCELQEMFPLNESKKASILVTRHQVESDNQGWCGVVHEIKQLIKENEKAKKIRDERVEYLLKHQSESVSGLEERLMAQIKVQEDAAQHKFQALHLQLTLLRHELQVKTSPQATNHQEYRVTFEN